MYIVFKGNKVVFSSQVLASFDDKDLVVTNNLSDYDPGFSYSVETVDGVPHAVKGGEKEMPSHPDGD